MGFTVKATIHALVVARATYFDGLPAMPGFFDSADELTYAYLIRSASAGFEHIAGSDERDVACMLEALACLRDLWHKMRLPLLIQTLIKIGQVAVSLNQLCHWLWDLYWRV